MLGEMIAAANVGLMVDFEDYTGTYGTSSATKGTTTGKLIAFDSEDLDWNENLEQNREMSGKRTRQAKVQGKKDPGGKLVHKATFDTIPWVMKAILGPNAGPTTTTNAGSGAVLGTVVISGGKVTSVPVTTPGTLYVTPPAITFSGGGGTGAAGYAVLTTGGVSSIVVTNQGTGYTTAPTAAAAANKTHAGDVGDTIPTWLAQRSKPFAAGTQYDLMTGIRVNTAVIKGMSTGFFTVELDVKGGDVTTSPTSYDAAPTDLRSGLHIDHSMVKGAVLLDGVATAAFADFTLNFNNNLDTNDSAYGSAGARSGLTPDDCEVKGSGTFRALSQALLDTMNDRGDHVITITYTAKDPSLFYYLTLPAIQFDPKMAKASGRGSFKAPFSFEAHDNGSGLQCGWKAGNARANAFYL